MSGRHAHSDRELLASLDFEPEYLCELHSRRVGTCGAPARALFSCQDCGWSVAMAQACYSAFGIQEHTNHDQTHRLVFTDLKHL